MRDKQKEHRAREGLGAARSPLKESTQPETCGGPRPTATGPGCLARRLCLLVPCGAFLGLQDVLSLAKGSSVSQDSVADLPQPPSQCKNSISSADGAGLLSNLVFSFFFLNLLVR